jgi:hypothetical protein
MEIIILIIIIILIPLLIVVSIIVNILLWKIHIDLLNINEIGKIDKYNYQKMEVVRKRRAVHPGGYTPPYQKVALEIDYPIPWINMIDDIIEVYGIKNNKKYLIFTTGWSKDNAGKLKIIVNNFNNKNI